MARYNSKDLNDRDLLCFSCTLPECRETHPLCPYRQAAPIKPAVDGALVGRAIARKALELAEKELRTP